jgi:mRNA interferase HigB
MHVISRKALRAFSAGHSKAREPLSTWYKLMKQNKFGGFAELRRTFGSVDKVGNLYVFDIGGNKYRLVAAIHFNTGNVFIRGVMTHDEYDREKWKQ